MASRTSSKPTAPDPVNIVETDPEVAAAPEIVPLGRSQTIVQRGQWDIDGKLYDVRVLDDFGLAAQRRLNNDGQEFYRLYSSAEELTADQEARMEQLLDRMFFGDAKAPSLIDAPKTLLRKLGVASRADVVLTFTLAPLQKYLLAAAQAQMAEMDQAGVSEPTTAS